MTQSPTSGLLSLMMLQIGFSLPILLFSGSSKLPNEIASQPLSAQTVLEETNRAREANQLPPLSLDPRLVMTAHDRAEDILSNKHFTHFIPNEKSPWQWLENHNYRYEQAAENLAIHFKDPKEVVTAWLESPGHRQNILNPELENIGLTVMPYKKGNKISYLIVQIMAQPEKNLVVSGSTKK